MNNWVKSTIGVSLAGLIVLLANYGKPLAEAVHALWLLTFEMSASAPLGMTSFAIALSIATLSRWFVRKWTPDFKCPLSRDFVVDASALLIAITVTMLQMWSGGPEARLSALWAGVGAGLAAPLLYNGLAAVFGLLGRALQAKEKTL